MKNFDERSQTSNSPLRGAKVYNIFKLSTRSYGALSGTKLGTTFKLRLACILANIFSVVGIYYWNKPLRGFIPVPTEGG